MEATGLAVGVAGIAGLFATCVECFHIVDSARSFGRDYALLVTKFKIEQEHFRQWGEGVGLSHSNPSNQHRQILIDASQKDLIEEALSCIKLLLTDAETLRRKYGMDEVSEKPTVDKSNIFIGSIRLHTLRETSAQLHNRISLRKDGASVLAKTKWAIRDCEGFQKLFTDFRDFVEGLYKLAPVAPKIKRRMVQKAINAMSDDVDTLRLVEEACSDRDDDWSDIASMQLEASDASSQNGTIWNWMQGTSSTAGGPASWDGEGYPDVGRESEARSFGGILVRNAFLNNAYMRNVGSDCHQQPEEDRARRLMHRSHRDFSGKEPAQFSDEDFEHLPIRYGIVPAGQRPIDDFLVPPPQNLVDILSAMRPYSPAEAPRLSFQVYERFMAYHRLRVHYSTEDVLMNCVIGSYHPAHHSRSLICNAWDRHMEGESINIASSLAIGFHPRFIGKTIVEELSDSIRPSKKQFCPIAPFLFLETGEQPSDTARIRNKASFLGAMSARALLRLQEYRDPNFPCKARAYSFTSTYCDGILQIYANYPVFEGRGSPPCQYHMLSLGTWNLTDSFQVFQVGLMSLLNIRDWAYRQGAKIIEAANKRHYDTIEVNDLDILRGDLPSVSLIDPLNFSSYLERSGLGSVSPPEPRNPPLSGPLSGLRSPSLLEPTGSSLRGHRGCFSSPPPIEAVRSPLYGQRDGLQPRLLREPRISSEPSFKEPLSPPWFTFFPYGENPDLLSLSHM